MSNQPYDPRYQQSTEPSVYNEQTYVGANDGSTNREYVQNRQGNPTDGQIEKREEIYNNPEQNKANTRYWIARVIYFVLGVLEVILAIRFVFKLLGASVDSGFVRGIYDFSYIFVAPFTGIFGNPGNAVHVFETTTLIAMIIYALIGWGLVSLARVLLGPSLSGRRSYTVERQRRNV